MGAVGKYHNSSPYQPYQPAPQAYHYWISLYIKWVECRQTMLIIGGWLPSHIRNYQPFTLLLSSNHTITCISQQMASKVICIQLGWNVQLHMLLSSAAKQMGMGKMWIRVCGNWKNARWMHEVIITVADPSLTLLMYLAHLPHFQSQAFIPHFTHCQICILHFTKCLNEWGQY